LKRDRFALEVEHTVGYLSEHRKQAVRIGVASLVVLVLVIGIVLYRRHQHSVREQALNAALKIQDAGVGPAGNPFMMTYPTREEKDKAASKAFSELAEKYSGSDQGIIARYYLGTIAADQGRLAEAEKAFQDVIERGDANYASLAKLSLADLYAGQRRTADAEKLLRSLIEKPTVFVSKEHAAIELAQVLAPTRPDEARKLLEPLRTERSAISRAALSALGQLPSK
jgi:predicted negative regulator of RcsB-dependent stress response